MIIPLKVPGEAFLLWPGEPKESQSNSTRLGFYLDKIIESSWPQKCETILFTLENNFLLIWFSVRWKEKETKHSTVPMFFHLTKTVNP
jgi:hypothetical protein